MDKKLLDAFANLSVALQQIADSLNKEKDKKGSSSSSIIDALKSSDIAKQIKSIDIGVKKLQSENKEIISNQKRIISLVSKKQESKASGEFGAISDPKQQKNIKDGVKMVVLIAAGVLAMGFAFKLIGNVDFKSVIALSISMPLLALAFEKVSKVKGDIKQLSINILGLILLAGAIVASSRILQYVKPISVVQLLTTVLIAGAFALLSLSIGKISHSIKDVDGKSLWKLPLVLLAASTAIAASSWILQYVKPVGFWQLLTVVFIAGAFAVLSLSLGKLVQGIKQVETKDLWKLPLVLVATSTAIMSSSWILSSVKPVGFWQLMTVIGISAAFVVLSYGLPKLVEAISKVGIKDTLLMPIILIALSTAIMASSFILSAVQVIPLETLLNIALQSIVLSTIGIVLGTTMYLFDKMNLSVTSVAKGSISLLMIATTVMLSSLILSIGSYDTYPDLSWTLGVATSMLAFGVGAVALGSLMSTGYGMVALVLGVISMLVISATVVATAKILGMGDYGVYPSWEWSSGVALTLISFVPAMLLAGVGIVGILLGKFAIPMVAKSIVETSQILSEGVYTGGPSLSWAMGTGLVLTAFTLAIATLGAIIVGTFGLGWVVLKAGSAAINLVAQSIVDAASILRSGNYTGGPTKEWAEGVGLAITAFAPVYRTLTDGGILGAIFGGGGSSPEKMKRAIMTISEGIVAAAQFFSGSSVAFKNGPPVEWAEGVGKAIGAFGPVYKGLGSAGVFTFFTGGAASPEDMVSAIRAISQGIVEAGNFFNDNQSSFTGSYPSEEWASGVGGAIEAFGPAFKWASSNSSYFGAETSFLRRTIETVAMSIVSVANILQGNYEGSSGRPDYSNPIPADYMDTIGGIYKSFFGLIDNKKLKDIDTDDLVNLFNVTRTISENSRILSSGTYKSIPIDYMNNLKSNIMAYSELINHLQGTRDDSIFGFLMPSVSSDISRMADDYERLSKSIKNLSGSIESINIDKIAALKTLTGSIVLMSLMDSDQFDTMMDKLEEKTKIFVDVIKDVEGGVSGTNISISASSKESGPSIQDVLNMMSRIDYRLGQLVTSNANLSSYVNEIRSSNRPAIKTKR